MITKEQEQQLYQLQERIEKETGIKVEIDPEKGRLTGFKAKPEQIKQVKEIIADFFGRETKDGTEMYSFRQWESKDEYRRSKQKEIDKADHDEPDLEPDRD